MSLPFSLVCDLLETLHEQCAAGKHRQTRDTLQRWFRHNRPLVRSLDARHGAALLSTLLPARRTDRVYCIQASRLEKIFARAQRLGVSRLAELYRYKVPGAGVDLADCVFAILRATPNPPQHVTALEVDDLLNAVASAVAFSSPAVRATGATLTDMHRNGLESMYMRLTPLEAKWFTRLVLKDYRPIELDEAAVLGNYHPVLPCIMKVLDHFCPALAVLDRAGSAAPNCSRRAILCHLKPVLGTKVGRPLWRKGRSIKHCLDMCRGRMSVEKKVDGEYCQIHVDLSKGRKCIQIFSKSGKDSTEDRRRLHRVIRESLDIGRASCKITKGCILEGELVVYSDFERRVLPFHKIRNHVTRSGRYMNNEADSPPRAHEHLMIKYYDVLLIDDESLLGVRHSERFERLKGLIVTRPGYAEIIDRHTINIGSPHAASDLRKTFARAIVTREEGLVLKPDDPFIDPDKPGVHRGSPIKFKKEYIGNFGDVGDFAVVAARYDPVKAKGYRIPGLKWTHFYLGCVTSKNELYTEGATPELTIVAVVDLNETMLRTVINSQPRSVPFKENNTFKLIIPPGLAQGKRPTVIFPDPLVFDVRCFSFDKEGNVGFLTPRFPVVSKVHFDRDYRDAITFPELQELAEKATVERGWEDGDSQEMLGWVAALEGADPGGRPVDCVSQETVSSGLTPSTGLGGDAPEDVSVVSSLSSGASSPMSSRSGVTLTPPTSLPEQPSSEAEDGDRADSPCAKKRKAAEDDRERECAGSPSMRKGSRLESCGSPRQSRRGPLVGVVGASGCAAANGTSGALYPGVGLDGASSPLFGSSPPPGTTARGTRARSPESTSITPDPPSTHRSRELANQCPLKGPNCPFHNRPLLLAPSLITRTDVKKALLQHGITSHITDHAAWRPEDVLRPDTWKVCFVDVDDEGGTREFLRGVEGRPLRRVGGREYVEVYDWRVLLCVGDMERERGGRKTGKKRDPFRRWFVGLV